MTINRKYSVYVCEDPWYQKKVFWSRVSENIFFPCIFWFTENENEVSEMLCNNELYKYL